MEDIKMSVTIELPGSTMMTAQECAENPENYEAHSMMLSVKRYDKKTKKHFFKKEPLTFKTRKCIPAHKVINMCSDAYYYMTCNICPTWYSKGISSWKKLSSAQRLQEHLNRICENFNGISYTYIVFGD